MTTIDDLKKDGKWYRRLALAAIELPVTVMTATMICFVERQIDDKVRDDRDRLKKKLEDVKAVVRAAHAKHDFKGLYDIDEILKDDP